MQKELDLEVNGAGAPDTNNLMRLIQGTVMPQVSTLCYCTTAVLRYITDIMEHFTTSEGMVMAFI